MEQLQTLWAEVLAIAMQAWADETTRSGIILGVVLLLGVLIGYRMGRPDRRRAASRAAPARADPAVTPAPVAVAKVDQDAPRSPTAVYRRMLQTRDGVPEDEINERVRIFATQVDGFRQALPSLSADDADLAPLAEDAVQALEAGDFEAAAAELDKLAAKHDESARAIRDQARTRFTVSAATRELAGDMQVALDDFEAAARWYRQGIEALPERHQEGLVDLLNKHATAAYSAGDYAAAMTSFDRVRKILEKSLGVDHPSVATALNNLALMYYEQGDYAAAEPLYRRALQIDEAALGPQHADVATDLNNLALLHMNQGNLESAEPLFNRSVAIKERLFALGHPSLVTGLRNYASLLGAMGRTEEAATLEARANAKPGMRTRPVAAPAAAATATA